MILVVYHPIIEWSFQQPSGFASMQGDPSSYRVDVCLELYIGTIGGEYDPAGEVVWKESYYA